MTQKITREESSSINPYALEVGPGRTFKISFSDYSNKKWKSSSAARSRRDTLVGGGRYIGMVNGKTRNFGMVGGTIQVRRPRVFETSMKEKSSLMAKR